MACAIRYSMQLLWDLYVYLNTSFSVKTLHLHKREKAGFWQAVMSSPDSGFIDVM